MEDVSRSNPVDGMDISRSLLALKSRDDDLWKVLFTGGHWRAFSPEAFYRKNEWSVSRGLCTFLPKLCVSSFGNRWWNVLARSGTLPRMPSSNTQPILEYLRLAPVFLYRPNPPPEETCTKLKENFLWKLIEALSERFLGCFVSIEVIDGVWRALRNVRHRHVTRETEPR